MGVVFHRHTLAHNLTLEIRGRMCLARSSPRLHLSPCSPNSADSSTLQPLACSTRCGGSCVASVLSRRNSLLPCRSEIVLTGSGSAPCTASPPRLPGCSFSPLPALRRSSRRHEFDPRVLSCFSICNYKPHVLTPHALPARRPLRSGLRRCAERYHSRSAL